MTFFGSFAFWQYFCKSKNIKIKNMNVTSMVMEAYEAPKVEVIEVEVEKGFTISDSQTPSFIVDDEGEW